MLVEFSFLIASFPVHAHKLINDDGEGGEAASRCKQTTVFLNEEKCWRLSISADSFQGQPCSLLDGNESRRHSGGNSFFSLSCNSKLEKEVRWALSENVCLRNWSSEKASETLNSVT